MSNNHIDRALAALGDAIKAIESNTVIDYKELSRKFPLKSLSGDHIVGGKIQNFSSSGITDNSNKTQLTINNDGVHIATLTVDKIDNLSVSGTLKTKILEVDEIKADIKFEKNVPIVFSADDLDGKGLLWAGKGFTKQFVFSSNPDRFFMSENLEFAKGKSITVNNVKLIDEKSIGPSITKSNLQELGRLKGLIVDGSMVIDQYIVYSSDTNRLGLGIEEPNSALSVAEDGIEIVIGTRDHVKGYVGTYASNDFDIVTDNTSRLSITSGGNITLGNPKIAPVKVSVHGRLSVRVSTPDPEVDLHVNGSVKFNNKLQTVGNHSPTAGSYNPGDIVWNSDPKINQYVGWICVQAGSPGIWEPFGKIGNS